MSISVSFDENLFSLKKLALPTRYYYFNEQENYIKLLSIGEGIFPNDRLKTHIALKQSHAVMTTESATKVYPSTQAFGVNYINIDLCSSNLEFLNDELIMYKNAKLLQLVRIRADEDSTFFYSDILTHGRSYEHFDFDTLLVRNKFFCGDTLEYFENFEVEGNALKEYIARHQTSHHIYLKIYIKAQDNESFLKVLHHHGFDSFCFTKSKKMIIGSISDCEMAAIKKQQSTIWALYREAEGKSAFDLGKQ